MMSVIDAPTQPRRTPPEVITAAEAVRVTSTNSADFQRQISRLRAILTEFPFRTTESIEKLVVVLQAVRQIVDLELLTASRQWQLPQHVQALETARADLFEFHLNADFQAKAERVSQDTAVETDFPMELVRDVAKYLDKLGKLTQDTSYHVLAAEVLTAATSEIDKKLSPKEKFTPEIDEELSPKEKFTPHHDREAYFLAHFERLMQLDHSESTKVDPDEVMLYAHILAAQDQKKGAVQNWDRQAAIGWMLFEFGMRRAVPEAITYGMSRVSVATKASGGAQTCMRYCAKRLVAHVAHLHLSGEFQVATPQLQSQIRQKLDLPQKEI